MAVHPLGVPCLGHPPLPPPGAGRVHVLGQLDAETPRRTRQGPASDGRSMSATARRGRDPMSQVAARIYEFTVTLMGVDDLTVEVADALFAAGCDDASACAEGPVVYLIFHREAESLGEAIGSAVKDVERAGFSVARVEVAQEPFADAM